MPEVETPWGLVMAQATARLREAGIPDARRQALRIWSDSRELRPAEVLFRDRQPLAGQEIDEFLALVERRASGEPLAYVTGWAGFRRLVLRCDRRALIPRPESEGLVELLLGRVNSGRVADVGTGSGCIALSLAQEGSYSLVVGVDRSDAALALARENQVLVAQPVELIRGDLCSALSSGGFDALISNPPYLTYREYTALEPGVQQWEPRSALVGGPDGLTAIERLLQDGFRVLRPGGWLALEVDCTRAARCACLAERRGWVAVAIHKDLFGCERYLLARKRA